MHPHSQISAWAPWLKSLNQANSSRKWVRFIFCVCIWKFLDSHHHYYYYSHGFFLQVEEKEKEYFAEWKETFCWTFIDNNSRSKIFENSSVEGTSASSKDVEMKVLCCFLDGEKVKAHSVGTWVLSDREAFTKNSVCVFRVLCMCLCLNAEMKVMHNALCYTGQHSLGVSWVKVKLPALAQCPMLFSEHGNDFKVKWVSGVHDNIFRQTTVVNHL